MINQDASCSPPLSPSFFLLALIIIIYTHTHTYTQTLVFQCRPCAFPSGLHTHTQSRCFHSVCRSTAGVFKRVRSKPVGSCSFKSRTWNGLKYKCTWSTDLTFPLRLCQQHRAQHKQQVGSDNTNLHLYAIWRAGTDISRALSWMVKSARWEKSKQRTEGLWALL